MVQLVVKAPYSLVLNRCQKGDLLCVVAHEEEGTSNMVLERLVRITQSVEGTNPGNVSTWQGNQRLGSRWWLWRTLEGRRLLFFREDLQQYLRE